MTDQNSKKIYGLLGRNISYSLSPAMHNAAFDHFNIPAEYVIFDKEPDELIDFFETEVLTGKISGLNVTVPYKIDVNYMLKKNGWELDEWARRICAVNTVEVKEGKLKGYNTDAPGFYDSLLEGWKGINLQKKEIYVAGAGGAGHAICIYLAGKIGEKLELKMNVYDPDVTKLYSLREALVRTKYRLMNFYPIEAAEDIPKKIKDSVLVINATPLGTKEGDPLPIDPACLREGQVVYDLVYARETELIKRAKEKGLITIDGLGMLINQAAMSFNIWTEKPLDEIKEIMKQSALEELRKRKA